MRRCGALAGHPVRDRGNACLEVPVCRPKLNGQVFLETAFMYNAIEGEINLLPMLWQLIFSSDPQLAALLGERVE